MPFSQLDSAGIARALSQIADRPADLADAFFERSEVIELPPGDGVPGFRVWRESGLAIRLLRDGRTWLAGRDRIDSEIFRDALRRVARAMPRVAYPYPELSSEPWPEVEATEVLEFPSRVEQALRSRHLSIPLQLTVCRHRRWLRIIGTQLASGTERESFYSLRVETPWARFGRLFGELGGSAADDVAHHLFNLHRARDAAPPPTFRGVAVLGAPATAVLLHEAVAHALEADTLAHSGHPETAIGVALGSESARRLR